LVSLLTTCNESPQEQPSSENKNVEGKNRNNNSSNKTELKNTSMMRMKNINSNSLFRMEQMAQLGLWSNFDQVLQAESKVNEKESMLIKSGTEMVGYTHRLVLYTPQPPLPTSFSLPSSSSESSFSLINANTS
jgi:hypothetical protein